MSKDSENCKPQLQVCMQMRYAPNPQSCANSGSNIILRALAEAVAANQLNVDVVPARCLLRCDEGPNVRLSPEGIMWNHVSLDSVNEIISKCKN